MANQEHYSQIQFGSGLHGPAAWQNFDASPSLRLSRVPLVGSVFASALKLPKFEPSVRYGDVVEGLPVPASAAQLVYSSHVLEHLSKEDCISALSEVHRILRPGGYFRSVLPDLRQEVAAYVNSNSVDPASEFMERSLLGRPSRPRGLGIIKSVFGNSAHLWAWDFPSMRHRLQVAGFVEIREAKFGDSTESAFQQVESRERWDGAFGFECRKK